MDRNHSDSVTGLVELVDDQHPTPRAQNEPQTGPAALELRSQTWELLERYERPRDTLTSVRRKREGHDQAVKVLDGRSGQCDLRHELQLVESNRLAGRGLSQPKLGTFIRAIYAVEDCNYIGGLRIRIVEGARQQRPGEGALVDMDASGEPRKLRSMLAVEGDVQPLCRHTLSIHATTRPVYTRLQRAPRRVGQTADNSSARAQP